MIATIHPAPLNGAVEAAASKSEAHRLLILAALAEGETRIRLNAGSADIEASADCLRSLGADAERTEYGYRMRGIEETAKHPQLDCKESGSTLRFLLPVAAALGAGARFTGAGRLPERPIGDLAAAMRAHGVAFSAERLPLSIEGRLTGGEYALPGNVSSQYITGLLLALPMVRNDSRIALTTRLESAGYVDLTLRALAQFGASVTAENGAYAIPGGQRYRSPGELAVDGDWSNGAFFLAAGALGAPVTVTGLAIDSPQGDRAVADLLERFGARVKIHNHAVTVSPAPLYGCEIDVCEIPDLLPVLAVLGAAAAGETRLVNAARLRLKESDRLATTANMIRALGGEVIELPDGLVVTGGRLRGGTADSANDHRIAMAASIAAIRCEKDVTILNADAVQKSYPSFYAEYQRLGGNCHVV